MDRPVTLNSIKFSDTEGNLIVDEGCILTFGNGDHAERYIQKRYKFWSKTLGVPIVIAPDMNETLHEIEVVKVFKLVARFYNILYKHLVSKSRKSELVEARRIAINICKERKVQDAVICRVMKINHSTVVHHKKRFKVLCENEPKLVRTYTDCEEFVMETMGAI